MKKIKGLLYCTKTKPYLVDERKMRYHNFVLGDSSVLKSNEKDLVLNGKIVAECDFDVEKIELVEIPDYAGDECHTFVYDVLADMQTKNLSEAQLLERSCLSQEKLYTYLDRGGTVEDYGYALRIKNLHIFDEPKELSNYHISYFNKEFNMMREKHIEKAPQNMCRAFDIKDTYILISIQPQELCRILNGEQTILIKKKVLKEMLENES